MHIGTAAPCKDEQGTVPHYFIQSLSPQQYYNAAQYEQEVIELLETKIFPQKNTAILSGGSMMYIDAVCNGIDELPNIDPTLRKQLKLQIEKEGLDPIRQQLKLLDPEFYKQVDLKNTQRVLHALEVCLMTGKPYSSLRKKQKKKRPFDILKIGLCRPREELYERINRRVDKMIKDGLIDECKKLAHLREYNALNTVGYKEIYQFLDGNWELEFAINKIKQNTRIYARKQMTWFKKDPDIHWFDLSAQTERAILEQILHTIRQ